MTQTRTHPAGPKGSSRPGRARGPGLVDGARWPGLADPGASALRAAVARVLFTAASGRLPLRIRLADGRVLGTPSPETIVPEMVIRRPGAFFRRLGAGGLIGFGESYMAGDWDSTDLTGVLAVFAAHVGELVPPGLQRLRRLGVRRHPASDDPTPDGARQNIHRHYDLSNDLFALFLDETMTYSSALFQAGPDGAPVAADQLLAEAQRRKVDALLDLAAVGRGTRLLEIGTGWGELAIRAGQRGARVLTVTISPEQRALAARRVAEAGLAGQVRVELRDYRELDGQFDAICSAEMIEAVGERYWPAYFRLLDRVLAPGGRAALQAITMAHDRMLATRHTYTWIHKYIFPGGLLPSVTAIENSLASSTRLRITSRDDLGAHYADTLKIWRDRFCAHSDEVGRLGFDEVFHRMWTFYLSYSEAGFRAGYIGVSQLTLGRV